MRVVNEISGHMHIVDYAVTAFTAGLSSGLILLLLPVLRRYMVAQPNFRSSHRALTPQGGGIAVIAATITVVGTTVWLAPAPGVGAHIAIVLITAAGLTVVGAIDDIRVLEAVPRLALQAIAVAVVVATLPEPLRLLPSIPWWIERALLLICGVWFVNLVNFMDGIDWMTVAEVVPVTAALALFGLMGALPRDATLVALALCGAMIGFAPFNRPTARLFLGDVGSLPIGLLLGWILVLLATAGHLTAALLLPLYYLADATITLLRRAFNGEKLMRAHRSHFYQRAIDGGLSAYTIVGRVFVVNIILAAFAAATLLSQILWVHTVALISGCIFVGWLLYSFESRKK